MSQACPVDLVSSPWGGVFSELLASATGDILVLSPYVTRGPVETMLSTLRHRGIHNTVRVRLVTDFSPMALSTKALDVDALLCLLDEIPHGSVTHLPKLHAKVYVIDDACAVVTSANLTDGGLSYNYEYGLYLKDPPLVRRVRADAEGYAALGADVSKQALIDLRPTADELADLQKRVQRDISPELKRALSTQSRLAHLKVLRIRASGKTTHGIFADTLMYLLGHGPQRTVQLHRLIQRIHPDLCDDTVDRVISGVHFGKKWKHYVRTAQQHLKRRGMIAYSDGCWRRTDEPVSEPKNAQAD